ncbi:MAG: dienelactone hydrolase family protein [Anaerolineae bacterium]
MCYDPKDRPPDPPGATGSAHGQDLELVAADGTRFMAFLAEPSNPNGAQLLIYPDVRGLHGFYKALALRFAETGVRALAIDYFGRTAGVTPRDETFEHMSHVQQLQAPQLFQDAQAGLARLRQGPHADAPTFILGFCMGGGLTLLSATQDWGIAGGIPFYAGLGRAMTGAKGSPLEVAHEVRYPILALFGGADQGIPVEQVQQLDKELDRAGVEHTIVVYPGAPHSFFDRKAADFADASADAWARALNFIQTHSQKQTV